MRCVTFVGGCGGVVLVETRLVISPSGIVVIALIGLFLVGFLIVTTR